MRCRKGCALNNFFAFFAGVLIVVQQRRLARCQRYAGLGLTLAGQDVEHIGTSYRESGKKICVWNSLIFFIVDQRPFADSGEYRKAILGFPQALAFLT